MAFLSYFLQFKATSDRKPSNSPNLTGFSVLRDVQGVSVDNMSSQSFTVPVSSSVTVFSAASKKFTYIESDIDLGLLINGSEHLTIKPVVIGSSTVPGAFFMNAAITALVISNPSSTEEATVYVASAE